MSVKEKNKQPENEFQSSFPVFALRRTWLEYTAYEGWLIVEI